MAGIWLDFKYSILGKMDLLIESLSEIEKSGLITKSLLPAPYRQYENEKWRIVISQDRVDFCPRRDVSEKAPDGEFLEAFELFSDYFCPPDIRLAINATVLFDPRLVRENGVVYELYGLEISQDSPTELNYRVNYQRDFLNCKINDIITISKAPLVFNGKPEIGVFVQIDVNTAPGTPFSIIRENVSSFAEEMNRLVEGDKERYVR